MLRDQASTLKEMARKELEDRAAVVLVARPEPGSVTETYALIKKMSAADMRTPIVLMVDGASCDEEAREVYEVLRRVSKTFLGAEIGFGGSLARGQSEMPVCFLK